MASIEEIAHLTTELTDVTWDEFLDLPFETRNAALIDGKVYVNSPSAMHEYVVGNLLMAWSVYCRAEPGRGEPSTQQPVKVNDRRGYQPDLMWYPAEQCAAPGERAAFSGLPGIVAEVFSPSTRRFDAIRKRGDYEALGIAEAWFLDPDDSRVLVVRRSVPETGFDVTVELGPDDVLTSPLLPAFEVRVGSLFER
jgi:Uma2 family endonuclease